MSYHLELTCFSETVVGAETLLHWLQRQVALVDDVTIENVTSSFKDGQALCSIISRYRPHLLDFGSLDKQEIAKNNQLAFDILEKELAIPPVIELINCPIIIQNITSVATNMIKIWF